MFSLLLALLNNAYFISYIKSKTFDLPLSAKEERFYLEKKEQGDKNARDLLIEKNLRLAAHIAKKYNNNKDLQEDLISIGTIGLIKAIDSYSLDKKTKLATYASKCIENEILMHLRKNKKLNLEVSLNEVIGVDRDGSEIVLEELIDNKEKPIIDQIYQKDNIDTFLNIFHILTPKEQDILSKRYGLNNYDKMTQNEIAKEYHISRSYVSRIEKKALIKLLKCYINKEKDD
ncbi:RNA polymerase sporulation sigma factor SigK [Coprobacillus sp. AF34-1BH]|uniref:RNA polymerase sporulation sigma factor SigK n=2 Tax=Faecalibacillus faecis TaxID=1982628 RepID=UPI000E4E6DCD|nr:RNA polymerase sporulation sigma factor SigK [Faecalibacillus faecis]RGT63575.1 RNA polymerase sporulation sigma factor SigK [Coprobacillus sp. AF18-40]RGT85129.1 RNA polymerase sporulation sigma factor SigK [Coprobacillus sp. AF18-15LB]RHB06379.1 RNA polymerase sporulation sigma factor SigK [Coprobacillus sp. AM42-12AC]RHP28323.1 RNA polymerase sporulation sigma factor SigK [Coprobacillus sp. AF34-1BH]